MSLEDNPGNRVPNIIWPSVVTPDDISAINLLRSQGQSLAASVAHAIIDEAKQLSGGSEDNEDATSGSLEKMKSAFRSIRGIILAIGYASPAAMVLEAEQAIRGEGYILDKVYAGFWGETVNYLNIQEIHPRKAVWEASAELQRQHYANILRQEGPLSVVDRYTAEEIPTTTRGLLSEEEYEACMLALEGGRQRFHQLYNAIQP